VGVTYEEVAVGMVFWIIQADQADGATGYNTGHSCQCPFSMAHKIEIYLITTTSTVAHFNTTIMDVINNKVYFNKNGNKFRITSKVNPNLHKTLPVGTYSVNVDTCGGEFYLETIEDFHLKGKLYRDVVNSSLRNWNTFISWPRSTGVLLVGEKGSGKTLLA